MSVLELDHIPISSKLQKLETEWSQVCLFSGGKKRSRGEGRTEKNLSIPLKLNSNSKYERLKKKRKLFME